MKKNLLLCFLLLSACADYGNSVRENKKSFTPQNTSETPFAFDVYSEPFSEAKMLAQTGFFYANETKKFRIEAERLHNKIAAACSAPQKITDAQNAWQDAMLQFHRLEALGNFNPKKEQLYSWPYVNYCGIDRALFQENRSYTVKGLAALEYLLFEKTLMSRCNLRAYPEMAEWNKKESYQKKSDRCRYALKISQELEMEAKNLEKNWDPKGLNQTKVFFDTNIYPQTKDAINAVSDAFFSIESLKDNRLGKPIGRHKECTNENKLCPENAEHEFSGLAIKAIAAQLSAYKEVFSGIERHGFEDLLHSYGHEEVAKRFLSHLNSAEEQLKLLPENKSLQEQILALNPALCANTQDRSQALCALHSDIRNANAVLKLEILSVLSLRSPPLFEGDND